MHFEYQAINRGGEEASGLIEARDRPEALDKLSRMGLQPFEIHHASEKAATRSSQSKQGRQKARVQPLIRPTGSTRLNVKQLVYFTEELGDLLAAGLQLEPALRIIEARADKSGVQRVASQLARKVRDGGSFASALRSSSRSFDDLYCNLASAGEISGALGPILRKQAAYLSAMHELRSRVMTALIYPAFLLVCGLGVTILFMVFLIPRLTALVSASGSDLPRGARFILGISEFFTQYWWLVTGLTLVVLLGCSFLVKSARYRPHWDRFRLRLPLLGHLQRDQFCVQFAETLVNITGNGLPLLKGLELARGSTRNLFVQQRLASLEAEVGDGSSLHRAMDRSRIFPPMLIDLVRVGEQTGQLQPALARAAERLNRDLNRTIERLSAMIQPVIILMMAGIVGCMSYLMISIIYDTISLLRAR